VNVTLSSATSVVSAGRIATVHVQILTGYWSGPTTSPGCKSQTLMLFRLSSANAESKWSSDNSWTLTIASIRDASRGCSTGHHVAGSDASCAATGITSTSCSVVTVTSTYARTAAALGSSGTVFLYQIPGVEDSITLPINLCFCTCHSFSIYKMSNSVTPSLVRNHPPLPDTTLHPHLNFNEPSRRETFT
jgi:hypothetical protein